MGRSPYTPAAITVDQQTAIEELLRRTDTPPRVRERLEVVKIEIQDYDLRAIAAWSNRSSPHCSLLSG
jgi:hypothetical protein